MSFSLNKIWRIALVGALSLSTAVSLTAQEQKRRNLNAEQVYVISAKAGGVSYVTGAVQVDRNATQTRQVLAKGDNLNDGDIVNVGQTGKAEILLNPGSYLRLAANTDLQFADTNLESLLLKMVNGSALIEASAIGNDGADITIVTPQSTISLEKSGIYRINVNQNSTEVLVWKGKATAGNEVVKAGRKATLEKGATTIVARFEKDESRDALDIWSKDRAKELAKLNDNLRRRDLTTALNGYSSAFSGFGRFGGFWVLNRFTGTYCYVPYGWDYYDSPYGFGYSRGIFIVRNNYPVVINPTTPPRIHPSKIESPGSSDQSPPIFVTPAPTITIHPSKQGKDD